MGKKKGYYSTNPEWEYRDEEEQESILKEDQRLLVLLDRKKRRGKEVTLVEGFSGSEDELKDLCKLLQKRLGTGGSAKEGQVIIQGDHRKKIVEILQKEAFGEVKMR